jgi:hypothetical protein
LEYQIKLSIKRKLLGARFKFILRRQKSLKSVTKDSSTDLRRFKRLMIAEEVAVSGRACGRWYARK